MRRKTNCPDVSLLDELVSGRVDADLAVELEQHLEECLLCAQSLLALAPHEDTLEKTVHRIGSYQPVVEETIDGWLIETIKDLPSSQSPSSREAGTATDSWSTARPDDFSFLGSPENHDELGRLGDYRVLELLGTGGMGMVFLAEDVKLRRQVAIKVIQPHLAMKAEMRQRFMREAQAVASLEHDHIVGIHQCGEDRGVTYLVMPLLQGESLERRLTAEPRLPFDEACRIARDVALGLSAAHQRGLVHRDLKPPNIWLDGATGRAKILDFGLAHVIHGDQPLTQSGAVAGTPHYLSPEQAASQAVDARSDLFSLGCALYRMGTGEVPFSGDNLLSYLHALANYEPPAPARIRPDMPAELSQLTVALLAKKPADRPSSAREVAESLQQIETKLMDETVSSRCAASTAIRPRKTIWPAIQPHKKSIALALILFVLLCGVVATFLLPEPQAENRQPRTPGEELRSSSQIIPESAAELPATTDNNNDQDARSPFPLGRLIREETYDEVPNYSRESMSGQHRWGVEDGVYFDEILPGNQGRGYFQFVEGSVHNFVAEIRCRVTHGDLSIAFRVTENGERQSWLRLSATFAGNWTLLREDRKLDATGAWEKTEATPLAAGKMDRRSVFRDGEWTTVRIGVHQQHIQLHFDGVTIFHHTDGTYAESPRQPSNHLMRVGLFATTHRESARIEIDRITIREVPDDSDR